MWNWIPLKWMSRRRRSDGVSPPSSAGMVCCFVALLLCSCVCVYHLHHGSSNEMSISSPLFLFGSLFVFLCFSLVLL
jgi:hypothetical protein